MLLPFEEQSTESSSGGSPGLSYLVQEDGSQIVIESGAGVFLLES